MGVKNHRTLAEFIEAPWRNEDELQMLIAQLMRRLVPSPPLGPWWTAVNPKPAKSPSVALASKAMGMRAGSPDIVLCWRGRFLAAELKTSVGKLSEVQLEQHPLLRAAGGDLATPRGVREFVAWLRHHQIPVMEEWQPPNRTD